MTHSSIERNDPQEACRIFRDLVSREAMDAMARLLANIIIHAHDVAPAAWSVSLFPKYIRINVGQVEVCRLRRNLCLVTTFPGLEAATTGVRIKDSGGPVYAAVPVPSVVVEVDLLQQPSVPDFCFAPLYEFISEAARRKSRSPFRRSFSPGVIYFLESALEITLPRPGYFDELGPVYNPKASEEVLSIFNLVEGAVRRIEVNAYERDARARRLCLEHFGSACAACRMSFGTRYGLEGLIHVHHLRPLSEIGREYVVSPTDDLRPVCPNCHAVIHSRSPPLSIEEVRALLDRHLI